MTTTGKATFAMKTWDEKPYAEIDGERKLTRAVFAYEGELGEFRKGRHSTGAWQRSATITSSQSI